MKKQYLKEKMSSKKQIEISSNSSNSEKNSHSAHDSGVSQLGNNLNNKDRPSSLQIPLKSSKSLSNTKTPSINVPPKYQFKLIIRQQPNRARSIGFGDRDRRPIDPPPILQLRIIDKSTKKHILHFPDYVNLVCHVTIVDNNTFEDKSIVINPFMHSSMYTNKPFSSLTEQDTTTFTATTTPFSNNINNVLDESQISSTSESSNNIIINNPPILTAIININTEKDTIITQDLGETHPASTSTLVGTLISQCYLLNDDQNERGFFFCFPDVSCRVSGKYRLKFQVFNLASAISSFQDIHLQPVVSSSSNSSHHTANGSTKKQKVKKRKHRKIKESKLEISSTSDVIEPMSSTSQNVELPLPPIITANNNNTTTTITTATVNVLLDNTLSETSSCTSSCSPTTEQHSSLKHKKDTPPPNIDLSPSTSTSSTLSSTSFTFSSSPSSSDSPVNLTLCEAISDTITVYHPKEFPGMSESTTLSKALAKQGVRIHVRNTDTKLFL